MGYGSPKRLLYNIISTSRDFAANTTYYLGNWALNPSTTATDRIIYVIQPCQLRGFDWWIHSSIAPTTEDIDVSIRVNNITDYTIGTMNFAGGGAVDARLYNHNINVPLAEGDYWNVKVALAAVFVTPPQATYSGGTVLAELE